MILALSLLSTIGCSQTDKKVVDYLNKRFNRMNLSSIVFFEPELVEYCIDSTHRLEMNKELERQKHWIKEDSKESAMERIIFLSILRERISKVNAGNEEMKESKAFLIRNLKEFQIDFPVDRTLIENRLNPTKRGLPYGDEECDEDFSYFVFFLHDPNLYVTVLKQSKTISPKGDIKFPTTCTLEELSHVPMVMKKRTQSGLLKILDKYQGQDFDTLRNKIKKADLSAHYD